MRVVRISRASGTTSPTDFNVVLFLRRITHREEGEFSLESFSGFQSAAPQPSEAICWFAALEPER